MTQLSNGRTAARALFEAGDRPTDQNFTDLFDSILFLGESNPNTLTLTSLAGNFSVGGSLSSVGTFTVNNLVMFGSATENLNLPLQVYGDEDETIIFASGSLSNILFEGISGDATSSIKLQDSSTYARFGTHTNKGFLEIHGEEIITYSTGSSAGDNIVYMSGSLGIGKIDPAYPLDVYSNLASNHWGRIYSGQAQDTGLIIKNVTKQWAAYVAGSSGNFKIKDSTSVTYPITIEPGASNHSLYIDNSGRIGIGTDNPSQKLDIIGGHIQLSTSYGIGAAIGSSTNEYIIYPYKTGMPTSFASLTAHGTLGNDGISLQSDRTINFIETDTNVLIGHMNLNEKIFDWDGVINAKEFKGDGSGLTNLTAASITNLLSAGSNNRVVTSTGANSIQGEVNLTFDGSKLGINTTPHQELHVKGNIMVGDNAGGGNFIHGRDHLGISADGNVFISSDANDTSGTGTSDIIFGYGSAVDLNTSPTSTYADSFPSSKPRVELMRLNSSNGRVGIGITAPNEKLTVGGSILASGSGYMTMGVNQTDSGQVRMGITSNTSRAHLSITSNRSNYPEYLTVQGTNNVMMTVSQSRLDVWDNVGAQGIMLHSLASTNGWGGGQFNGDSDVKINQIYFTDHAGSSDNGWIRHETSGTTGNTNKAQLHIAPSDDDSGDDLISFGSSNPGQANSHKFYTSGLTYVGGYLGINQTSPQNMLHVRVDTVSVGTAHNNDIGILIQQDGVGDAGIEFEVASGQYWSTFVDATYGDLLIRDISNSRTLAQFTDAGNVVLGHSGHVYGRSQNAASTKLYRFGGLYLTWDSDSYGTDYNHSITSTRGVEATPSDDITINSYGSILMNIDSNDNGTETFKIGHKTVANDNILFTLDETGLITTTNTIKMADSDNYWLATGNSTNWGLYWNTADNTLQWRGGGTEVGYIDLDNGNAVHRGWVYGDYFRATEVPGGASASEVRLGKTSSGNALRIQASNGYLDIGPQNTSWCHFYTDTPGYYFDEKLVTNGNLFASYGASDLKLRRDYNDTSYNEIVIGDNETYFRQDNDIRFRVNNGNGWFDGKLWVGGDNFSHGGTTAAPTIDLAVGDSNTGLDNGGENILRLVTGGTTRVTVDASGRVGIGAAPTSTNEYGDSEEGLLQITNGSRPAIEIKNGEGFPYGGAMAIYSDSEDTAYSLSTSPGEYGQSNHGSVWWVGIAGTAGTGQSVRNYLTFWDGEAGGYFGYSNIGFISFTGQHFSKPSAGIAGDYTNKIGQIVIAEGTYDNFEGDEIAPNRYGPNVDESLPKVTISTQANDKRVFGVISKCEVGDVREGGYSNLVSTSTIKPNDHRLVINSIGEGAIWVSNINGNLENGDYITTSAIEGLGMKQDDDLLHNYTVAKITQDCDFTSDTTNVTHNGVTYKSKLVGCTYHCG